jgi:NDP-sugar pyrophosphorylase family protein
MLLTSAHISLFPTQFPHLESSSPWQVTLHLTEIIRELVARLGNDYVVNDGVAVHSSAIIEPGALVKAPAIIGEHCFVGANSCLRNGVYLDQHVKIGMACEIKTSIVFSNTAVAHFNFIGDSILGSGVNFEAGAITANHYNEREDKSIFVIYNDSVIETGVTKFGSLVGDHCKIGANAVLSPGTILAPHSIVKRLALVDQWANFIVHSPRSR